MDCQFPRVPSGCAVAGLFHEGGKRFNGEPIIKAIAKMHNRTNGLGGGFAAYGIYPERAEYYAFHMMLDSSDAKVSTEEYLEKHFEVAHDEVIPTQDITAIKKAPILWRYFLAVPQSKLKELTEEDYIVEKVTEINSQLPGAYVASSGKNMGAFKGVGFPGDVGEFYRLREYEAYCWTAHGRFPTNSVAWWGGAHPFGLLDWSVVHNGEVSSYGTNKRYLENHGYKCTMQTDTEVVTYSVDLLHRKHKLPLEIVCSCLAAPMWEKIKRMNPEEQKLYTAIRMVYNSVLLNGPFAIIVANRNTMVGLNDRIKLRPMVAARKGQLVLMATEESAIIEICSSPDKIWMPKAGEPVIARLEVG